MWIRTSIGYIEGRLLALHHFLRLPTAFITFMYWFYETLYCLLYRLSVSESNTQFTVDRCISKCKEAHMKECDPQSKPNTRVAIVTGANGGIGFETARAIGKAGFLCIIACRDMKRGARALQELKESTYLKNNFELMELDLSSFTSIENFANQFKAKNKTLELLVCNAGVAFTQYDTTYDGLEMQFGTNYVGHYILVKHLLKPLRDAKKARVTFASSIASCMVNSIDYTRVTDVWRYSRFGNYATSKLALILFSNALARRLKDTNVTVNSFHPGLVDTGIYRHSSLLYLPVISQLKTWWWLNQFDGSVTSIFLALDPSLDGVSGKYFAREQETPIHPDALDIDKQERLWKFTQTLIESNTFSQKVLDSLNSSGL